MKHVNHVPDCHDPDVADWVARVVAAGSSVSRASQVSHCIFVTTGKLQGWWSTINRINTFAGADLTAALVPLKRGVGGAVEAITGTLLPSYYSEDNGINNHGDAIIGPDFVTTDGFLDTSVHISLYNIACAPSIEMACGYYDPGQSIEITPCYTDLKQYAVCWSPASFIETVPVSSPDENRGVIQLLRTGTAVELRRNGVVVASNPNGGGAIFPAHIPIFAADRAGGQIIPMTLGGYALGLTMTPTQAVNFAAAWTALSLALGRPV